MPWGAEKVPAVPAVASLNSDDNYCVDREQRDGEKSDAGEYQDWRWHSAPPLSSGNLLVAMKVGGAEAETNETMR